MNHQVQALLDRAQQDLCACDLLVDQGYYIITASRAYYAMFYTS